MRRSWPARAAVPHGEGCTAFRRKLDPGSAFPWDAFKAALTAP